MNTRSGCDDFRAVHVIADVEYQHRIISVAMRSIREQKQSESRLGNRITPPTYAKPHRTLVSHAVGANTRQARGGVNFGI